jgi:hypothetical protein
MCTEVWSENLKGSEHLRDFCVDRIILKCVLKVWFKDLNWIELAEDTIQWRIFMNTVMNFEFHKRSETVGQLSSCQCFKEHRGPRSWSPS